MIRPETATAARATRGGSFDIEITRHEVALAGLPDELAGATVVQLSDLHRGNGNADALIRECVRIANAQEPDIVAITGDFVNCRKRDVLPAVKLVSCVRARYGVYATIGNHDHRADPVLLASALDAAGITVLDSAALEAVPGLWVAGIDDLEEGAVDIEAALRPVPPNAPCILLTHRPDTLGMVQPTRPLLMLAGHTHGGQFVLPFPTPWMICRFHLHTNYVHGWYRSGALQLYVNRGIGVAGSWPLNRRINCRPEVAVFRLRTAPATPPT